MKIGVVIVSHYRLGEEMLQAARLIVPDAPRFFAVGIEPKQRVDEMRATIAAALDAADQGHGVLVLTDMFGGTPSNVSLSFLGERRVGSDYLDVIAARGYEGPVARALATALRDGIAGWDLLDLLDLGEGSKTPAILREIFRESTVRRTVRMVCPWERFEPGETFESFLRRTRRRDNFLRRKKWLEKQPGIDKRRIVQVGRELRRAGR